MVASFKIWSSQTRFDTKYTKTMKLSASVCYFHPQINFKSPARQKVHPTHKHEEEDWQNPGSYCTHDLEQTWYHCHIRFAKASASTDWSAAHATTTSTHLIAKAKTASTLIYGAMGEKQASNADPRPGRKMSCLEIEGTSCLLSNKK